MFCQAGDMGNETFHRQVIEDILSLPLVLLLFCYVKWIAYPVHYNFKNWI